jgi:hypothetical protein
MNLNFSTKTFFLKRLSISAFLLLAMHQIFAQATGVVSGTVRDKSTQEPLIGVSVAVEGTTLGAATDVDGRFRIAGIPTGSYNIKLSLIGYKPFILFNVVVTSGNANTFNIELEEMVSELKEVEITANRSIAVTTAESPNSIQRLTTEEIRSNPGGNFDISRVVQSLPGVSGTSGVGGFRNDIIIRGGAPNENVYYLDGIEIPVINHFSTQGSAGGPVGILNVSFIEDVTLKSSNFDARYDNALASVFQFKQREGNPERFQGNVRLSSTELALTTEGPLSKRTNFLASVRRSYLQFLFQAIDLPIRPNYWDFQYKITHKINPKTTLNFIGVGAIDEFSFAQPRETTPENDYVLRSQPSIQQWNYTFGMSLRRSLRNGYLNVALSRNMFDNSLDRFEDRQEGDESRRLLRVRSQEIENKLRVDVNKTWNGWKYAYGAVGQYVKFNNDVFTRIRREIRGPQGQLLQPAVNVSFDTGIDFFRYGAFVQVARSFLKERLSFSGGLRTDMNNFTTSGNNPLETLSPRAALSYLLSDKWSVNVSAGRYYKLPIYTILGFQNEQGQFANKDSKYTRADHYVAGLEFIPRASTRFTLEGFWKNYANYPISIRDGISLANQGGEFGAIGNEAVRTNGTGRAYGFEFFFQQKLTKNIFAVFSYTFVRSEFAGINGVRTPSAWDNRHLISALFGRKFNKGWEMGLKYRFAGGAPYTPFDLEASQRNFASLGTGLLDFNRLNTLRLDNFSQFDFRIDKKWNLRRTTIDLYFDVQNAFVTPNPAYPRFTFQRTADNSGFATTDGQPLAADGSNGIPVILLNNDPSVVPTLGFIIEF